MQPAIWEVPRADPVLRAPCSKQGQVPVSAQSGGWCLERGRRCQTCVCSNAAPLTLAQGRADAVWWLLLLRGMAEHRGSFQLSPGIQGLLVSPEILIHVACLGDWVLSLSLETVVRGSAPPSMSFAQQKDWQDRCWAVYPAQLHWRASTSLSFSYLFEEVMQLSKEKSQRWDFFRKHGNLTVSLLNTDCSLLWKGLIPILKEMGFWCLNFWDLQTFFYFLVPQL